MATLKIRRDATGHFSLLDPTEACLGCGVEPEVESYFIRRYPRSSDKVLVSVRVGYHCSCGAVVVDGMFEGATLGSVR